MKQFVKDQPLVSICCITYNHAAYIRDALEGFLMQNTNFPFEVLIHDDASTDKTADIIREYESKYPDIIKPIYQTINQYSQHVDILGAFVFPCVKGKYIAMCEGDDYWTDPLKLQKQVDFLEKNDDYVMCFHQATLLSGDGRTIPNSWKQIEIQNREYGVIETYEKWCIFTASVVYRTMALNIDEFGSMIANPLYKVGDIYLWLHIGKNGKFRGMSENMSVYRIHNGGVSSLLNETYRQMGLKNCYYAILHLSNDFSYLRDYFTGVAFQRALIYLRSSVYHLRLKEILFFCLQLTFLVIRFVPIWCYYKLLVFRKMNKNIFNCK